MNSLDYWRLCDSLTVIQASLLIIGEDPGNGSEEYVLGLDANNRPNGFNAVFASLKNAVKSNKLFAKVIHNSEIVTYSFDGDLEDVRVKNKEPDWNLTTISVENLKAWLAHRNFKPSFFFSDITENRDYLDKNHPQYSPKLATTIKAWEALRDNPILLKNKTVKQALIKWFREHASIYGFTDDDGLPLNQAIEDMAKVGNWNTKGGVAKTYTPLDNLNPSTDENIGNNHDFDDLSGEF